MTLRTPETECALARDLLVPYIAGDTSPTTKAWVENHLARCAACRHAHEEATGAALPPSLSPTPSADAGQRLLRRVRKTVLFAVAVVVVLALAVGGLSWAVGQLRRMANMPAEHPVPAASVAVRDAVTVDLSPLGLRHTETTQAAWPGLSGQEGWRSLYQMSSGTQVELWAYQFADPRSARRFEDEWEEHLGTKVLYVTSRNNSRSASKFRSGGNYYYTWSRDGWFMVIAVPESAPNPTAMRDQIRDLLFIYFTR